MTLDEANVRLKLKLAEETVKRCIGRNGIYASTSLYTTQYWIRDVAYSFEPLLDLGLRSIVKKHLEYTLQRQKPSGEIPPMIIQTPPSIRGIILLTQTLSRRNPLLLFRRIPTHDSNLLLLISVYRYVEKTGDVRFKERHGEQTKKLWRRIDSLLVDGLLPDADWRDAMLNYVSKTVFCNQILLATAYRLAGRGREADEVKRLVNTVFWSENLGCYQDYPCSNRFDTLGHALAVLEDIVPEKRYGDITKALQDSSTKFGFRNINPSYPEHDCAQPPGYYQNSAIWPFIQGYTVAALAKMKRHDLAEVEFKKFTEMQRFNEWYNPSTGVPGGSDGQLWSAASYINAYKHLETFSRYDDER